MSDIFVSGCPEGQKPQVTDVHWRSEDGTGAFNWRMKFPVEWPTPIPTFKFQIWDKDIISPNDAIAEANLNLRGFYKTAYKNEKESNELAKQWLTMTHVVHPGVQGRLEASFELLNAEAAKRLNNGLGRSAPNDHPFLEEPIRPDTSFAPWRLDKLASKVVWGQNKKKIIAAIGCAIACVICVLITIIVVFVKIYL